MRRIPTRYAVRNVYSSSIPIATTPGGGGGTGGGGDTLFTTSTSFHSYMLPTSLTTGSVPSTELATFDSFTSSYNLFSSGITYVAKDTVIGAVYINSRGNIGSICLVAYNIQGVEVARSQPKDITADLADYLVVNWKHGLTLGPTSFYAFVIEFTDLNGGDPALGLLADGPFFAFTGTGSLPGGGGGTGGGGGGGGGAGSADIRSLYLSRYIHGATQVVVDGTSIQDAIDSMPSDGGIILVKEGSVYNAFSFVNKNFTSFCSVMNFPAHTPQISGLSHDFQGNERAVVIDSSSKCGVYGLDISSVNASGHPFADGVFLRNSHHCAVWSNNIHDCVHGVGAADDGSGGCDWIDSCYNKIHDCAGWLDTMASAISYFKLANIGGGDGADGYSSHIIGNIIWNAVNDASYGGAITDGNGIIIDIANGEYSSEPVGYTGHTLVANNICVSNGGRGVHAFFSRYVHQYFNTCALNLRSSTMVNDGEVSQYGNHDGAASKYNLIMTASNRENWIVTGDSVIDIDFNVIVNGSNPPIDGSNVDKTSVGPSYFVSASSTNVTAANWKPVTPDTFVADFTALAALQDWPDAAYNYRASTGIWSAGAVDAGSSGGSSGSGMPTEDLPGYHIVFSDDFVTDAPLGSWGPGVDDAPGSYAGRWRMYGDGTPDTAGNNLGYPSGYYPTKTVSVQNSILRTFVHTESGTHMASALLPKFGTELGNQLYGRYAVRMRSDSVSLYKVAWLLWPQSETWPRDGEIDFPESALDGDTVSAFMHRQEGVDGGDQDGYEVAASLNDWHTYVIEWGPTECNFYMDGVLVGSSTSRIPDTPMHYIMQTETNLSTEPSDGASGYVECDWIVIWAKV